MIGSLLIIFGFPLVALIGLYFFLTITKSHRLRVRYNINGRKYVKDYLMKEKKDRESKDIYWLSGAIWQKKIKVEKPPERVIDVGAKGKYYAECYANSELSDGTLEVTWLRDSVDLNKTTLLEEDGVTIGDAFRPYSTTQRSFVVAQHKKELERKSKALTIAQIMNYAVIGMFFITLMIFAIFGKDFFEGVANMENSRSNWIERMDKIADKQLAITEAMGVKVKDYDVVVSQAVTTQKTNVITTTNEQQPKAEGES